jgi:ABC-type uncharacterized transport system YnjBCD ATPase subunit
MRPGEVLALMGPSGSGKTSLLSVISGRTPRAMRTSGSVTANGMRFTKAAKRRVGFVLQDDLLYEVCVLARACACIECMSVGCACVLARVCASIIPCVTENCDGS